MEHDQSQRRLLGDDAHVPPVDSQAIVAGIQDALQEVAHGVKFESRETGILMLERQLAGAAERAAPEARIV